MKRGKPLKRKGGLRPQSAKALVAATELAAARVERERQVGPWCEGDTPACYRGAHRHHHAHHVRRRSQGGEHTADNLRLLCYDAHDWVHTHVAEAKALGLLA